MAAVADALTQSLDQLSFDDPSSSSFVKALAFLSATPPDYTQALPLLESIHFDDDDDEEGDEEEAGETAKPSAASAGPSRLTLLNVRSRVHLALKQYPQAYRDAADCLDESLADEMTKEVKVECVSRCGEAAFGATVWDLAVVHFQEAHLLLPSSPFISSLRTTALTRLHGCSNSALLTRKLAERKEAFLEAAFPGIGDDSEEDEEWESDDNAEEEQ